MGTPPGAAAVPAPRAVTAGRFALLLVLPLLGFWAATALVGLADYENGLERSLTLLVAGAGAVLLPYAHVPWRRLLAGALVLVLLCLVGYRWHQAGSASEQARVPTIDIGTTTIAAVELIRAGRDPYVERIDALGDAFSPNGTGLRHFGGYKYGPVMTAVYLPGVRSAGTGGYFLTSAVALLLLAAAAGLWAQAAGGTAAGLGAAALLLSVAFIDGELFYAGVNDVVPMAFVVGAFAARARGAGVTAGVLLGLSFGAKIFPAALLALPLLLCVRPQRLRLAVAASAVGALAYLAPLLRAPRELLGNLVVFNLSRPGDRTGLQDGIREGLRPYVKLALLALLVLVLVLVAQAAARSASSRRLQAHVAALTACAVALFYAGSPVLHRNWLFWIVPFFAVTLALRAWGTDGVPPSEQRVGAGEGGGEDAHADGAARDDRVVGAVALGQPSERSHGREDH